MHLQPIAVFHIVRFLVGYTIQVNNAVLNFQGLSRQSHTTLHIVLATVYRTCHDFAKHLLVLVDILSAYLIIMVEHHALLFGIQCVHVYRIAQFLTRLIAQAIDVFCRHIYRYGIARREVEHHDVVKLHFAQSLHTLIIPCRPFEVRLGVDYRQSMLGKRHVERSLWNTRAIASLAHEQVIAHQQRLFQR